MADYFDIAQSLLLNDRWKLWLSPEEGIVFINAAKDQAKWTEFMKGPQVSADGAKEEPEHSQGGSRFGGASVSSSTIANFRIREMIFEQLIPELYPDRKDFTTALVDRDSINDILLANTLKSLSNGNGIRKQTDVDDEYDENSDVGSDGDQQRQKVPAFSTLTEEVDVKMDIPIDDMYYSYDYDVEAMDYMTSLNERVSREELELFDHENDKTEADEMTKEVHSSLKYLFMVVNKQAEPERLQNIKTLLDEVRPSRSKWHSENIGQEELYAALEKVLNDLKNYTAHSFPFLKPVAKREAPDYYDVIKHPMDLGTMTTKLNNHQYQSKAQFSEDLYLIWSNCMLYNTIPPDNIYRRHATAMRRKTTDLLKKVPDITIIKSRADEEDSDDEEETPNGVANDTSNENGISVTTEQDRPAQVDEKRSASVLSEIPEYAGSPAVEEHEAALANDSAHFPDTMTPAPPDETTEEAIDEGNIQERRWKDVTMQYRYELCSKRRAQLKRPFPERQAIVPTRESLGASVDDEREYVRRNKRRKLAYSKFKDPCKRRDSAMNLSEDEELEIALEESFLPELKYTSGCVPSLPYPPFKIGNRVVDPSQLFEDPSELLRTQPSLSDFPEIRPKRKGILNSQIDRNIKDLQKVKEIHAKILGRESGVTDETPWRSLVKPYQPCCSETSLPPFTLNSAAAADVAKQSVAKLLMHSGFDVASESALCTLTDTFLDYFHNIGKTLRLYMDKFSKTMSPEDLLLHALQENGVENVNQLDTYIRHDIERYGDKLYDLRRKMSYAYKDMVKRADGELEEDDIDVEEAADDFMSGNFFGDLDMLSLRELGIEGITSIPRELWSKKADRPIRARVRRQAPQREEENAPIEEAVGKPSTIPWRPVDIHKVIGLLRPFYDRKRAAGDMIEDEFKEQAGPSRAKIHLSQAKVGRKRSAGGGGGDEPPKKKKKGPDPALKAQREAEKQRKAQEKANRLKLKEEQVKAKKGKGKKAGQIAA
ncbi:uncharacterized protein SPPG_03286 [Spizellomyces punctatus DAOM BR117]|uniref:Bromo domain-containing protein n=1 Tax=Spizellomyces punctatus (strain DAOM BR117) TaxID=645134 RepID=A0A0L0HKR1_SPIPD|nr:uncharacterized protein SPPG_03286 [Spizellomyces punctatus DAOM BR117]KND01485.1 hypothetical protein SPPG_03286 [Spizellomyces punctatus DAOM BR117]|eukprot:XP_016609524.1 hypothetical protein SPPG_03286 [Spizellomyces punctatus DAOM BR117]